MGVRKYRSVEQMPTPPPLPPLRAENFRLACNLMELAEKLSPITREPGIRKFRSVEEASRFRSDWLRKQITDE